MKTKSFIFLIVLIFAMVFSLSAVCADDLQTADSGQVSGDVDVVSVNPYTTSGELTYDVPADAKEIKSADVYVNVYSGSAKNTYGANANVTLKTQNGENQIASEELWIENGTSDGTVYPVNDHVDKCYSDYQMRYDITDSLKGLNGTSISIKVDNFEMTNKSFDGRIKLIALVLAYDDGDADEISYWIDSAQRWTKTNYTFSFDTAGVTDIAKADLTDIVLSSANGNFTLNGELLGEPDNHTAGSTYQYNYWDVTDKLEKGKDTEIMGKYSGTSAYGSLKNVLSVLKIQSTTPIADVSFNTEYTNVPTCYAGTNNTLTVKVKANKAGKYMVELVSSDGAYVTDEVELDGENETTLLLNDPTVRPIDETTVNGANNTQVTYTVDVIYNGAVVGNANKTVPVLYNGNLGHDYEYDVPGLEQYEYTIQITGDVVVDVKDESTYLGASDMNRTDVWNINLPEDTELEEAYLFIPYNWFNAKAYNETKDMFETKFNGYEIVPLEWYRDQGNLGNYGQYGYGVMVYSINANQINTTGSNTLVLNKKYPTPAVYPSALVYMTNVPGGSFKDVELVLGADLLANSNNNAGRVAKTDSVVNLSGTDYDNVTLYVLAASAQKGESNIVVNGLIFEDVWSGSSKTTDLFTTDITGLYDASNNISFVATGSTIVALPQILVADTGMTISIDSIKTEYTSVPTAYAGTNNTITATITVSKEGNFTIALFDGLKDVDVLNVTLTNGTNTVKLLDPTIRPVDETTVNGADNKNITYLVAVLYNGNIVLDYIRVPLLYNGNLGHDYEYDVPGLEQYYRTTKITGDVVVDVKDESTYLGATDMNRTDVWNISLPEGSELKDVYIIVPYNWFNGKAYNETIEMFDAEFNGYKIVPLEWYRDQGNLGNYGQYGYGVMVYNLNVNQFNTTGTNTLVLNKKYPTPAVYPSTLVYMYDVSGGSLKDVELVFGADLLANSNNNAGRVVKTDSVVNLHGTDYDNVTLYVFAASAQKGEGNIDVNGKVFEDVWSGSSKTTDLFKTDITDLYDASNNISFVATGSTILALPQIIVADTGIVVSIDSIKTEYTSVPTAYAGTGNLIKATITVTKDGNYSIMLFEGFNVLDEFEATLTNGTNTVELFDGTVRPVDETTVNGADNKNVTYTVVLMEMENKYLYYDFLTVPLLYNGYLDKKFEYNATYIEDVETYTVNGGVEVDVKDDSTYMSASALNRTDVWNIDLAENESLAKAFVYLSYNWDKTGNAGPALNVTFNGNPITPKSTYRDQGNLGKYGSYGYGLYIYDVSEFAQAGNNTLFISKEKGMTALYPSSFIYLYNSTDSSVITTVYMANGADLLSDDYNAAERLIMSDNVIDVNASDITSAKLYVFAASAQKGEGNIVFNDIIDKDVWDGSSNSVGMFCEDITDDIADSNNISFIATGSTILALNQMIVTVKETPEPTPIASEFTEIVIQDDLNISFVLKDANGNAIANAPITYIINGTANTTITAADGSFVIPAADGVSIDVQFEGNKTVLGTNITIKLNVPAVPAVVKVASQFNITDRAITINGYAVDGPAGEQGIYYATTLLDENGNPIPNAFIEFAVNNKIYNRTTYENGSFKPYKLNMVRAGRYTMAFNFAGDDNYTNAFACVCVDLDKKPITIKASAKSYKVATKTKKYTATLSTIKGLDGKMYLSPQKVSLKVNGKTFTAKTNSKGQVTFKITNLNKKAKYTAVISYEGDKTYESASKKVILTVK